MVGPMTPAGEYIIEGVALDTRKQEMLIDLSVPRSFVVRGEDPRTQKTKMYMLRVTNAGGLVLQ